MRGLRNNHQQRASSRTQPAVADTPTVAPEYPAKANHPTPVSKSPVARARSSHRLERRFIEMLWAVNMGITPATNGQEEGFLPAEVRSGVGADPPGDVGAEERDEGQHTDGRCH